MTQQNGSLIEINALLAKAKSDCETRKAPEKYREACSNLEARDLERSRILREAQNEVFTGDDKLSRLGVSSDRGKLMSALSVAYEGCSQGPYRTDKSESPRPTPSCSESEIFGAPRKIPTPTSGDV